MGFFSPTGCVVWTVYENHHPATIDGHTKTTTPTPPKPPSHRLTLVRISCQLFIAKLCYCHQPKPTNGTSPHFSENIVPTSSMFRDVYNDRVVTNDGERVATKRRNGVGYIVFLFNFFPELCEGKIIKKKDKR
jgi:hypothetical protein